jgi:toxin ParE1/3/4
MRVRFTPEALGHISGIQFYIEVHSPDGALRIVRRIWAQTERLGDFPNIGHDGVVGGTREWTVPDLPYLIVYELNQARGELVILGVFHGAQNR